MQPEIDLTHGERALLAALTATEGFKILQRIMRSEVDKFVLDLINADEEDVLYKHRIAKAAAQFFTMVVKKVNTEVELYANMPKASDKPVDATEGLLDLGDFVPPQLDVDDLLGEGRG